MGLQVLDDERPGYAILEFDPAIEAPTLSISVHSRLHDSYLGRDGEWQKTPYFFPAERVGGDASSTRYRIGPAIVNHMMAMDQIEVAAEDGRISAETVWENAVPEIFAPSRHRIYRHPAARPESITGTGPVQAPAALKVDPTSDEGRAPPDVPPTHPRAEESQEQPPSSSPSAKASPLPVQKWAAGAGAFLLSLAQNRWTWAAGGVSLVLLAAVLLVLLSPSTRCWLFGSSCPQIVSNDSNVNKESNIKNDYTSELDRARACATEQKRSNACNVESCFTSYFAMAPSGRDLPEVQNILADARSECARRADEGEARKARDCADTKLRENTLCEIRSACVMPYVSAYPSGRFRPELEARALEADRFCEDDRAFKSASTCASITDPCRMGEICLQPYLSRFANGRHVEQARSALASATAKCRVVPALPDGEYRAIFKPSPECGEHAQFGKRIYVSGGRLSWTHDFKGIEYNWSGTIDAEGTIQARTPVAGSRASGKYRDADQHVDMFYPSCGPIHLEIGGRLK
jgi:hypothetical protein